MCSLYILDISPLLKMCFANIFSQPLVYLFIHLILSFTEQNFFKFNEVHLINFYFIDHAFGILYKNSLSKLRSLVFFLLCCLLNLNSLVFYIGQAAKIKNTKN